MATYGWLSSRALLAKERVVLFSSAAPLQEVQRGGQGGGGGSNSGGVRVAVHGWVFVQEPLEGDEGVLYRLVSWGLMPASCADVATACTTAKRGGGKEGVKDALAECNKHLRPVLAGEQEWLDTADGVVDCWQLSRTFSAHARHFFVDNKRWKALTVQACNMTFPLQTLSGPGGHFYDVITIPSDRLHGCLTRINPSESVLWLTVHDQEHGDSLPHVPAPVHVIDPVGITVVSDIDDTIKVSNVLDKKKLFYNSFFNRFKAVEGMSSLYQSWSQDGASFHYLSASPWQLYVPLMGFLDEFGFPRGPLLLRNLRFRDRSLWSFVATPPLAFKRELMDELLAWLPGRRLVLVGDTSEKDPEIFQAVALAHPGRIAAVVIRYTPGAASFEAEQERVRALERRADNPFCRWFLFTSPAELPRSLHALVGQGGAA
eukprot:CAMPEP_0177633308 /NCGR_PEP_ID=MMETSP0447-20121125/2767_1 /TAXON_ID=0 /ORGANISM="Stygamoeba regulata, Strain BSH-02190019" /LENGTH=429 /DNA_ID=CAMNT_0019134957 /DNA_START=175 /DNA_END=1464 /DNA_ORIENTATION=+